MLELHILTRMCIAVLAVHLLTAVSESGSDFGDVTCGIKPVKRPDLRIFNGRNAALGGWPWSGRIEGTRGVYTQRCSMSLIGREWALTAGHCVNLARLALLESLQNGKYYPSRNAKMQDCSKQIFCFIDNRVHRVPNDSVFVLTSIPTWYSGGIQALYGVFGEIDNAEIEPSEQRVEFDRIIVHPQYGSHPNAGNVPFNDIALLHFKTPVNLTDYVHPICINEDTKETETYDNCWIVGWGFDIVELPRYLQASPRIVLNRNECDERLRHLILDTELCGTGKEPRENSHDCQGDSGGGMACLGTDQRWYLVGISAWGSGYGCNGDRATAHTRVSNYTEFIESVITRVDNCRLPDTLCSDGKTCLLIEELCDDKPDCPDGADEGNCSSQEIPLHGCTITTCQNGGECRNNSEGIICVCTDGWTGYYCEVVDCGPSGIDISVGGAINLTSPGYPSNYADNVICTYYIYVPEGFKVLIGFEEFRLENHFDFLVGFDQDDIPRENDRLRFTGENTPRNLTSETASFILEFTSDANVNDKGFSLMLSAINVTGLNECDWSPCENGGNCSDEYDGYQCDCTEAYTGQICHEESVCGDSGIVIHPQSTVSLSSYMYPSFETARANYMCRWTVTAISGLQILVKVVDLLLSRYTSQLFLGGEKVVMSVNDTYISDGYVLDIQLVTRDWAESERFLLELSEIPDGDECASQPCQNGGRCYDNINGFTCKCRRGYTGKTCEIGIPVCGRYSFACNNLRCITTYFVCDGRNHCGDGSDEEHCACEFRCHNGRCIPARYVCDSKNNCQDWSDELRPECGSD